MSEDSGHATNQLWVGGFSLQILAKIVRGPGPWRGTASKIWGFTFPHTQLSGQQPETDPVEGVTYFEAQGNVSRDSRVGSRVFFIPLLQAKTRPSTHPRNVVNRDLFIET